MRNLWLARDKDSYNSDWITMYEKKPEWNNEYQKYGSDEIHVFWYKDFKSITGITLKPGECRKIKSIKIELEK